MPDGSRAHQRIVFNIVRLLSDRLDPGEFDAVHEMRVDVGGKIRYPDVAVCAGSIPGGAGTSRDAVIIFEVLSADAAETDLEEKRDEYAKLHSRYAAMFAGAGQRGSDGIGFRCWRIKRDRGHRREYRVP